MNENRDRAQRGTAVLDMAEDQDAALIDTLTDLMHYCNRTAENFEASLQTARGHFREEVMEETNHAG